MSGQLLPPLLPLRAVRDHPLAPADRSIWPATLPPVRQLLDDGLELGQITVLTGDNGAGKSTLVEAIAGAYGLNPEGGGTGAMHSTRTTESRLADHLQLVRGAGAAKSGFFLRAETMHSLFTYYEEIGVGGMMHERSHGESFLGRRALKDPGPVAPGRARVRAVDQRMPRPARPAARAGGERLADHPVHAFPGARRAARR
ncbi:ATP-binding cassette domain-containing protein [Brachybacterium sp. 107]|uniref:ATP-binding cassette domain-containing protein n=1 Tax=Brachybacterium sp. 107 TaxID=3457736 RepID=UPI00403479BF